MWLSELTIAVDLGRKATKQTNKTNIADPDEMLHNAAFHFGLHFFCQSTHLGVISMI